MDLTGLDYLFIYHCGCWAKMSTTTFCVDLTASKVCLGVEVGLSEEVGVSVGGRGRAWWVRGIGR